jgi:hypothetical protein
VTKVLTESDYKTRKVDLAEAHRMAADAFKLASHKLATGNGTAEDLAAAKAHMEGVAGQQDALEAAWVVQMEADTENAIAQRNEQWAASRAAVEKGLAERQLAADAIVKALDVVGEAYARYNRANDEIITAMRPWAGQDFQKLAVFRQAVTSNHNSGVYLIAGHLADYNITFGGIDFGAARTQAQNAGLSAMVRTFNAIVAERADSFAPDGAA